MKKHAVNDEDRRAVDDGDLDGMLKSLNKGRWKRYLAMGALFSVLSGGFGYAVCSIDREYERKGRFEAVVEKESSRFKKKRPAAVASEMCIRPGSRASVLEEYISLWGVTARKDSYRIVDGKSVSRGFCIRPVDGGQDISLESRIRVSGLDEGDFRGLVRHSASLSLEYSVPEIMPYSVSISGVTVNGRSVPVKFLTKEGCSCRKEGDSPSLDIGQLLDAKLISGDDLKAGLDIRISSVISVSLIPQIGAGQVAGTDAYRNIKGDLSQYLKSSSSFPADHKVIRGIVADYGGKHDDVLDIMRYALDVTDAALDYYLPELNLSPVAAYRDGRGDCDDYASLYVTILRAFGVPAQYVEGSVTNSSGTKIDGRHAWAEVLVPFRDGSYRWVLVEPTWADRKEDPYAYINFVDSRFLYDVGFEVRFSTDKRSEVNVLHEHEWVSKDTGKLPGT